MLEIACLNLTRDLRALQSTRNVALSLSADTQYDAWTGTDHGPLYGVLIQRSMDRPTLTSEGKV